MKISPLEIVILEEWLWETLWCEWSLLPHLSDRPSRLDLWRVVCRRRNRRLPDVFRRFPAESHHPRVVNRWVLSSDLLQWCGSRRHDHLRPDCLNDRGAQAAFHPYHRATCRVFPEYHRQRWMWHWTSVFHFHCGFKSWLLSLKVQFHYANCNVSFSLPLPVDK